MLASLHYLLACLTPWNLLEATARAGCMSGLAALIMLLHLLHISAFPCTVQWNELSTAVQVGTVLILTR